MAEVNSIVLPFKKTVAALTDSKTEERHVSFDGKVTDVYFHFPDGCADEETLLVDARILNIGRGGITYVVPGIDGVFISLNGESVHYSGLDIPVIADSRMKFEIYNYDELNSHTITAEVIIKRGS